MKKDRLPNERPWLALHNYELVKYSGLYLKKNILSIITLINFEEIIGNTRTRIYYKNIMS